MANTFSISGAPKATTVSTSAALISAIAGAKAGEVITLDTVVAPFILTLSQPKAQPGICVVLPQTQQLAVIGGAKDLNTEIVGGYITAEIAGVSNGYSLWLGSASGMAIRGGTIGQGGIIVQGTLASDIVIADTLVEWATEDYFQLGGCVRFQLLRIYGRNLIKGEKIRWFDDGRAPVDRATGPGTQNASVGWWDDTDHNDGLQIRSNATTANSPVGGPSTAVPSSDFLIDGFDVHVLGAGLVNYDWNAYNDLGLSSMDRIRIQNSDIRATDPGGIAMRGNDLQAYNCTIGPHPTDPGPSPNFFRLQRLNGASRVRGGNNTLEGVGTYFDTPAGVDISGSPQGDADVVDPTPPRFGVHRLPWAPSVSRPVYTPWTAAPEIISAPKVYWTSGGSPYNTGSTAPPAPVVGAYLTAGQGTTKGYEGSAGEWRWTRNGTPISGANGRVYQLQSADAGTNIRVETRRTNSFGTGAWLASAGVAIS